MSVIEEFCKEILKSQYTVVWFGFVSFRFVCVLVGVCVLGCMCMWRPEVSNRSLPVLLSGGGGGTGV